MYRISRLANGLTIATAEMPHMASVSVGIWVGVGGRYEPAALNGVSHFIEHMLFKGTRRRDAAGISQAVEGVGGYLNAFTTEEHTCFYARAIASRFEGLLEVLLDMFLDSVFDAAEIEKERDVIREELAMYLDQPNQLVHELLNEVLFPGHPLGRPLTGTRPQIDTLGRRQMLGFLRANYTAESTLVCAAGQLTHEELIRAVKPYAKRFRRGKRPLFEPFADRQEAPRVRVEKKDTAQTQIALGVRACSRHDERRYALRLLSTLLGENASSRLFQTLREDRGLAYHVHSSISPLEDTGVLVIDAGLDPDRLPLVMKLMAREFRQLSRTQPSMGELRRARDYLIGQLELHLEGTENQMDWIGEQLLAYGRIMSSASAKEHLHKVSPAEIRSVAGALFRAERMNLVAVSPDGVEADLARFLAM